MKRKRYLPQGCTEAEIKAIADHYDNQTDEEAAQEDERYRKEQAEYRLMRIPPRLVKIVEELIELYEPGSVRALISREAKAKRPKVA